MNMDDLKEAKMDLYQEFNNDSRIVGEQTAEYLRLVYPSYLVDRNDIEEYLDAGSKDRLQSMTFFRISSCTADNVEKVFEDVSERFQKLFAALYAINIPIAYGIQSLNGVTNLIVGIYRSDDVESVKSVMQGMLSGIELDDYSPVFTSQNSQPANHGILTGVPSLYVKEEKQRFSLSSIMRSLNGQNYTLMFIAKPVGVNEISQSITKLIAVRDKAFAVSKRNIARSNSFTESSTETNSTNDSKNSTAGQIGSGAGAGIGAAAGAVIGTFVVPGLGTVAGTALGGAVGGGLGTIIGNIVGQGKSHSEGYSESISKAISEGETVSGDIQNGFAVELMNYADNAIERLKAGQNNGMWQTAITYSAENEVARNIIKACLCGELSKLDSEKLPMLAFEPKSAANDVLRIPSFLDTDTKNPLCSYVNSSELGLLCTVPTESVPDFELRLEKRFPLIASRQNEDLIKIGNVVDGNRYLKNMPFSLSELDLCKHTFVCGITGSGKTTTVKKLLIEAQKPFLVIESAKKEYRNLSIETDVLTLGKPEINAPKINPFYIMPGVSPQVHIDYLKDLFNASFSFYGPMPYILEKCLHSIYRNKGWDLTLGYHPLLANSNSPTDFFSIDHTKKQYEYLSHEYLFPTMQELKDEISRYVDEELKYDGEVAGNVKTAMKVRLENLCVGAKGYTFNTNDIIDFETLLQKNAVFELEGLADDSDKAFSVGLLVIFINEFRQVQKELSGTARIGLQHLLVIEEAHRLLKNVETERTTETAGNPKGKAVEHFTNMIAEMRSYGQGVIVAEQIPTKLAPDVIKNSSTKIVQRIVSADDQQAIANTIGITGDDAIQLGFLKTGYAYCHKEGMVLPASVHIIDKYIDKENKLQELDVYVSDEQLYNNNPERFSEINLSVIRSAFGGNKQIKTKTIAFLNTIMSEDVGYCEHASNALMDSVKTEIKKAGIHLTLTNDPTRTVADFLTETVLTIMVRGVYCTKVLPDDDFVKLLKKYLYAPTDEDACALKEKLKILYTTDLAKYARTNVAALIRRTVSKNTDIPGTIREYYLGVCESTANEIEKMMKGGSLA